MGLNPNYPEAINNRFSARYAMGNLDESLAFLRKSLRVRPNVAQTHNILGTVLEAMGNSDEAVASFLQALDLNPTFAEAYNNRGCALVKHEKTPAVRFLESISDTQRRVTIRPIGAPLAPTKPVMVTLAGFLVLNPTTVIVTLWLL